MKWTIDFLEEEGIVIVKTSGVLTWEENKKMSEDILRLAREYGTNQILTDHRDTDISLSILQIDDLPKMFREIGVSDEDRIATLYNPSHKDVFEFFHSVAYLASLNFRLFTDENEAIQWLKSEDVDSPIANT